MLKYKWNSLKGSLLIAWFLVVTIETTSNMNYRIQSQSFIEDIQEMIISQQQTIMKQQEHIKLLYILNDIGPTPKSQPNMSRDSILIQYNHSETRMDLLKEIAIDL